MTRRYEEPKPSFLLSLSRFVVGAVLVGIMVGIPVLLLVAIWTKIAELLS